MADLYVGGLGFKNRFKTLGEALKNARQGDVIHLTKSVVIGKNGETFEAIPLTTDVVIKGEQTISVAPGSLGIDAGNVNVTLDGVTLRLGAKSNFMRLPEGHHGVVTLKRVKMTWDKGVDPRDWYPPVFSQSSLSQYVLDEVESPYVFFKGQYLKMTKSRIGNLFGPQSILNVSTVALERSTLNHARLVSIEAVGSLNGSKLLTQGGLTFEGYSGLLDGVSFQLTFTPRFDRQYLDSSYVKTSIKGLTFLSCSGLTLKDYRQRIKGDGLWQGCWIQDSDMLLSDLKLVFCSIKNRLENSTLKFQNVVDESQWQEVGKVKQSEATLSKDREGQAFRRIQSLVGLENVKKYLDEMIGMAITNEELRKRGLQASSGFSLHQVFGGNPGTGKTTVAKLFGEALYEEGILPTSNFKVATRKDLVAEYVGQTAIKTHELIERARGGVLLIDEAYSLRSKPGANDFAAEAVDQLVMDSEEYRGDTIIILAGYTNEMRDFIENANPGLKSRFKNWIDFPDYNLEELIQIVHFTAKDLGVEIQDPARLEQSFANIYNRHGYVEGNARYVRNYVQDLVMAKNLRVSDLLKQGRKLSDQELIRIENQDVLQVESMYLAK